MSSIREYASPYATKLAYVFNTHFDSPKGLVTQISDITKEKDTTAKNWLFNGRVPREPKRLAISDAVGTSVDYLFNDNIPLDAISKPEIMKQAGCYFVPFLQDKHIFKMKHAGLLPVAQRIPIMFPELDDFVAQYGKNIYATKIARSNFRPHIDNNATVLCTGNVIPGEYKFVLVRGRDGTLQYKRMIIVNGEFKLLSYTANREEVIEPLRSTDAMLLVLLAFSC